MRRLLSVIFVSLWIAPVAMAAELPVLVYHDIVAGAPEDDYAISQTMFAEQMRFLHEQGYHPVNLQTLDDVAAGRRPLPDKAIVLTFDDGLRSFQQIALPVLHKYGFPAVVSICTSWMDGRDVPDHYRGRMLTWSELQAVSRSPLIDVLSHTDRLHVGIPSNPQGNVAPAGTTRRYDPARDRYESDQEFRQRIHADLARSVERLRAETGRNPVGITWPYGYADGLAEDEARSLGLRWQLTITGEPARTEDFPDLGRIVLYRAHTLVDFERLLKTRARPPRRVMIITLDDLIGRPDAERERWLSALLVRLELLRIDAVIVYPFDHSAMHAFFPAPDFPGHDDYLNRVLYQIRTRGGIRSIYLRLPAAGPGPDILTELARRQPYDGIVLSDTMSPEQAAQRQTLFARYRPGLRCGTEGRAPIAGCADFRIVDLGSDEAGKLSLPKGHPGSPTYIVVGKDHDATGKHLADVLRRLQRAGVSYVGLQNSGLFDNPEIVTRTAVQLAEMGRGRD